MAEKISDPAHLYLSSPKIFHLEMPLYVEFDLTSGGISEVVFKNVSYNGTIDAFCIYCNRESVFTTRERIHETPWQGQTERNAWLQSGGEFDRVVHSCTRDQSHKYYAYYRKTPDTFVKIGQSPSSADFQVPQAAKYRKILGEDLYKEFTRGIGLAAHGVGIGSFVYLRRVFESQIREAHDIASTEPRFNEAEYTRARMDEKIQILRDQLPSFLVENRALYSILSKGVHELTEEECLAYFEPVKVGIEQILDEKIERKEKEEKSLRAREAVKALRSVVVKKSSSS